jgi:hypothetical protein
MKSMIAACDDYHPEEKNRILAGIPQESLDEVAVASRTGWLDAEIVMQIDVGLHKELGDDGLAEFWRRFTRTASRIPILKPVAEGIMRLLASPPRVFGILPRAWGLLTRDMGTVVVRADDRRRLIDLRMADVPPLSRPDLYNLGNLGSYRGVLDLLGTTGEVLSDPTRIADGEYRFEIRWE